MPDDKTNEEHAERWPGQEKDHLPILAGVERAGSVLSIIGCVFIIATFCASKSFHKPVNRLVFFATFGNMLSVVATLMSRSYIERPASAQCQFQAFLIQMFMPADAYWTLAMAVNVHLTFYHKFDADGLRKMEVPYLLLCYGIPFVPAFSYIWIKDGWSIYGDATLWCWITPSWEYLHIATFYGPVWLSILITAIIYIRTGRTIYEKRRELHEADSLSPTEDLATEDRDSGCGSTMTTDISVTTKRAEDAGVNLPPLCHRKAKTFGAANEYYTVTITSEPPKKGGFLPSATCGFIPGAVPGPSSPSSIRFHHQRQTHLDDSSRRRNPNTRRRNYERNRATWSYTKCSILFFLALIVTWVPSSAHRVYDLVAEKRSIPLESASALVLPMQGFWRAVIYCFLSWEECKDLYRNISSERALDLWRLAARKLGGKRTVEAQDYGRGSESRIALSTLTSRSTSSHQLVEREASGDGKMPY